MSIFFVNTQDAQISNAFIATLGAAPGSTYLAQVKAFGLIPAAQAMIAATGATTAAALTTRIVTNLGLTGIAADGGTSYLNTVTFAGASSTWGSKLMETLNLFTGLANDPIYGAAASSYLARVNSAVSYSSVAANNSTDLSTLAAAVGSAGSTGTGSTFTLTTGVDNFPGTGGNDTFNATSATLNSFDNINGGAGADTFNYAESGTALFALPAALTLAGVENIAVSRSNTGTTTGEVAITNTTFGTGVTSLSYTEASAAAAMTGATVAVTLNDATTVKVAATGTGTFTTVAVTDTATTATTGSKLTTVSITKASGANTLTGNGIKTLNLEATGGLTTVTAAAGARELTVNTSGTPTLGGLTDATATTLNINVTGAAQLGTFTAAKATTVNYSSTAANVSGTLTAALATTLNVSGTKLATLTMTGNTVLATVKVTGSAGLTTDLTAGATAVSLLDTSGTTGITTVTVNVGTAVTGGAGNDKITVGATTKAIDLGAGTAVAAVVGTSNEILAGNTVTLLDGTTALGVGGSIKGGTGTNDELILLNADAVTLSASNAVTTAFKAAVTGFEILNIGLQSGTTVDVGKMGTFSTVKMTTAAAAQILAGVTSGQTIEAVFGAAGGTSITTNNLTGGADNLTLKLSGDLSGGVKAFGILATPGAETVNIVTNDTNVTHSATKATATLNNTNATSIVVTGNNGLTLIHNLADGATASTNLFNLDASGLTKGGIGYTSGVLTTDSTVKGSLAGGDVLNFAASVAKVNITAVAGTNTLTGSSSEANTITGGSGIDTIVGGAKADIIKAGAGSTANTITAGAGKDSIDLTGSTGVDTIVYAVASTTVGAAGVNVNTITNFTSGTDKIQLTAGDNVASATTVTAGGLAGINLAAGSTLATLAAVITDNTSVADLAAVYTALDTILTATNLTASATGAGNIKGQVVTFTTGASAGTYVVINDVTADFQAATDLVIQLVGTTTFAASDLTVV